MTGGSSAGARGEAGKAAAWLLAAACFLLPLLTFAAPAGAATEGDDSLHAYLLTMGPGSAVYEKFGHNAIWIHDPSQPPAWRDVAFHYGLFDFDSTFILRFIQKDLRYSMGAFDARRTLEMYHGEGRWVRQQELNLSQQQIASLRDFLHWNVREENASYDYDYYRDNCSTRVRDALDRAAGGQIRAQAEAKFSSSTYRSLTREALRHDLIPAIGVDFMIGPRADRPLSNWELMFLPPALAELAGGMTLATDEGGRAPLVAESRLMEPASAPAPWPSPPLNGLTLAIFGVVSAAAFLGLWAGSRRGPVRLLLLLLLAAWCLLIGFGGGLLGYVMLFSRHEIALGNENIFHGSPLALLLVPLLRQALKGNAAAARRALRVTVVMVAVSLLAALLKLAWPAQFPQHNWGFIAWLLPANIAMGVIFWSAARAPVAGVTAAPTQ